MRLGTAIEHLVEAYIYASDKEWIQDKVAWALYQTWKEADRKTEPSDDWICTTCKHDNTTECRECGDGGHYEHITEQTERSE